MRKVVGSVLLGLGAFLLVAAALGRFWAPSVAQRTPLDVDTTYHLTGTAQKLDPSTGKLQDLKVRATSVTKADSKISDDEVVAFVNHTCLVIDRDDVPDCVSAKDPDGRLVTASVDVFATDRVDAQAVNQAKYLGKDPGEHKGLINKWPFHAQKTTYAFWDTVLRDSVEARYTGTATIDGLRTYKYTMSVPATRAVILPSPDGESDVEGVYTQDKTVWVEPTTGSIVNQSQHETRTLDNGDTALDLTLAFTPDSVKDAVDYAQGKKSQLDLLTQTVPLVGLVGGLALVVIGFVMLLGGRQPRRHSA